MLAQGVQEVVRKEMSMAKHKFVRGTVAKKGATCGRVSAKVCAYRKHFAKVAHACKSSAKGGRKAYIACMGKNLGKGR